MSEKVEKILALCRDYNVTLIDFKTVDLTGR